MNETFTELHQAILDGDVTRTQKSVQAALAAGHDPGTILTQGMIAAMKEVGCRFEQGEYFVPEMLIAARAMQSALTLLKPHLVNSNVKSAGKVAIGTVKGDLHDIGKNLVALMLEGAGYEIVDMGVDVPPEKFIDAIANQGVNVVALSALLTTTMQNMKVTINAIQQAGLRDKVKIIVGGAPLTQAYADEIGADGFAADAGRGVSLAQSLLQSV